MLAIKILLLEQLFNSFQIMFEAIEEVSANVCPPSAPKEMWRHKVLNSHLPISAKFADNNTSLNPCHGYHDKLSLTYTQFTKIPIHRITMGSHHHQAAILVQDEKLDCLGQLENFFAWPK